MDSLSDYHDEKRLDDIINEIIELKYDKTKDNKLRIQQLQQEMTAIEKRKKYDRKNYGYGGIRCKNSSYIIC